MTKKLQRKEPPKTLIQANEISRAIYSLSAYGKKLLAMAMSMMSPDDDDYSVIFTANDFIEALEVKRGGETIKYLKAALREVASSFVEIERPDGTWEVYPWLHKAKVSSAEKIDYEGLTNESLVVFFHFNPELGDAIKAFKAGYSKIQLINLGKLQSKYAIRFYELAVSYAGFAGQGGNRRSEWWFEMSLEDIRIRFVIEKNKYKATSEFRRNIIDKPIEEINAADIGIRIEPEYIRKRKRLVGVHFNCRWVKPDEPRTVQPATETGKSEESLREAFPEEYEKVYKIMLDDIKKQPELIKIGTPETRAHVLAIEQLRIRHPEFFNTPKKKGSKKTN